MKDKEALFQNLFVFDMANNHMGDVKHGIKIINEIHSVTRKFGFQCAMKFQYRDIDTFNIDISPASLVINSPIIHLIFGTSYQQN